MPTTDAGIKNLVWSPLTTAVVAVGAFDKDTQAPVDLLEGGSALLPDSLRFTFDIPSSDASGFDITVFAVFLESNALSPSQDAENKKIIVGNLAGTGTLNLSNVYSVRALARYFKLAYQNNGGGSTATEIGPRYAPVFWQGFAQ